jgi:hypothetical protein
MNAIINVNVLEAAGYVGQELCECPTSPNKDFDDYTITIVNLDVTAISCDVKPALHAWAPPG